MWKGVVRLEKESPASKKSHIISNHDSKSKSNNTHSTIHGDDIKVTVNLHNNFLLGGQSGNDSDPAAKPLSSFARTREDLECPSSDSTCSSASTSSLNRNAQNPEFGTTSSTNVSRSHVHWTAANDTSEFVAPSMPVPLSPQRSPSVNSLFGWSIFSNSENSPKMVQPRDVKRHLPKHTEDYIKAYMANDSFFDTKRAVSLWKPSPSDKSEAWTWKHHIYVGDVGILNEEGGFDTIFNIFNSKDENLALGYDPPSDFIRYPKALGELNLDYTQINYRAQPHKALKLNGIDSISQKKQSSTDPSPIDSTYRANGTSNCSAIYLESGYYKVSLSQWDRHKVLKYVRDNQDSWQQYIEEVAGAQFCDHPLLVIVSSYRTQNCALAAGSKPILKNWGGSLKLKEFVEGPHMFYSWEVDDDLIHTQSAPSSQHVEGLDTYYKAMDEGRIPDCGSAGRKETRECHCVGITAFRLKKKGWRGSSILTGVNSTTTLRS